MTLAHNPQKANEFLQRLRPGGPHVLTAISVDKKSIETATFRDPAAVQAFLEKHPDRNIYYGLNPLRYDMAKKASREDVKELAWIHTDVDPRAGESIDAERQRALKLLQNHIPKPTWIVFSGGGYQAGWKLLEPMPINGEEALYQSAYRYNQSIELALGADNVSNVDRILRLPGSVNWPDARKVKKGQVPALAELVEWDDSRVYPLGQFTQAPAVQTEETAKDFGHTHTVQISGNIARVADVNDLPGISDLCKIVIVQGFDVDDPGRFKSRSEGLFFVCCECVRNDIPDDVIYSVITDPEFLISASVLDKGRGASGYALKQIERARLKAIDPHLMELNDKYAVVSYGGKMRVIYEDWDDILERQRLIKTSFEDFCKRYMNVRIQIGTDAKGDPRYEPLGGWWLKHEKRRQYEKLVFVPGRDTPGAYNLWRGFAFTPMAGVLHQPLLDHILNNVCGGDAKLYDYVVGWMANAVQHPDRPGWTAIVMRGKEGAGKGFLARKFGRLFGRHFLHVSQPGHLTGNFNLHLRDCSVLLADEAFFAGDKKHASVLKTLITENSIMVEPKGVDSEMEPNFLHIMMASNDDWVIPAGPDARRYCVLDVAETHKRDKPYFDAIDKALLDGGYSNLLHYLMHYNLTGFDVTDVPQTAALQDQKDHTGADPWYDFLFPLIGDKQGKLLAEEVWKVLGLEDAGKRTQDHKERLGRVMNRFGCKSKQLRFDSELGFCYVRGEWLKGQTVPRFYLWSEKECP